MKAKILNASAFKGIALVILMASLAILLGKWSLMKSLSLSPLVLGILLGIVFANTLRTYMPPSWATGLKVCTKQILRLGIILYGFRLTLADVYDVGLLAISVDLIIVLGTILLGWWLGKLYRMDRGTTLLVSTGSAICGAAAVLGTEPVLKSEGYKTAIAVATVVLFGTLSMFLYPIMYRMGWLDVLGDKGVAIYTGSTLHEVAHVVGAGNAMDPTDALGVAKVATITKMIRVILLAPVLIGFSLLFKPQVSAGKSAKAKISIPWFALYFILVIGLNTLLQQAFSAPTVREIPLNGEVELLDTFLLTMAMTALGMDTTWDKFVSAGARPFLLASSLYIWLLIGGFFIVLGLSPILS